MYIIKYGETCLNEKELKEILDMTTKTFLNMSDEEHRLIRKNTYYDNLFFPEDAYTGIKELDEYDS